MRPLDRIDSEILAELRKDARLSNKELAHRVGLAASSCHTRVARLVDDGIITGFHATVSPAALGVGLQALVFLQLQTHEGRSIENARDRLLDLDEVVELYHIGGSQDLILRVGVRDADHLRQVVLDGISARVDLRHVETSIIFEHKRALKLPGIDEPDASLAD